jgi:hypothetical protein
MPEPESCEVPNPDMAVHSAIGPTTGASPLHHDHHMFQQGDLLRFNPSQTLLFDNLADDYFNEFGEVPPGPQYGQTYTTLDGESIDISVTRMDIQESPQWLPSSSMEAELDSSDGLNPQLLGNSGDMDPYLLQNYRYDQLGSFQFKQLTIHSVCQGAVPTQFLLSQPGMFSSSRQEMGLRQISYDVLKEELETLVSIDTGTRLIGIFRKFIFPQYPIFSDSLFPEPHSSPPYLLAAIYMVAQPFAKFDDVLAIELAYENLNSPALFKLINEALQYEAHNPSLFVVQTMLLLVLRPSTNPLILESSSRWSLHGQLVSTSQTLGLHHDPSAWGLPPWQVALRRRISSTIFSLDKWLAASLGRPPLVPRDSWLVTSLGTLDSFASSLGPELWSEHICYTKLGPLLGDILSKL